MENNVEVMILVDRQSFTLAGPTSIESVRQIMILTNLGMQNIQGHTTVLNRSCTNMSSPASFDKIISDTGYGHWEPCTTRCVE